MPEAARPLPSRHEVIIVGAGLSGLSCALELAEANVRALVVESAECVGGRVRTERREGFVLDRGFQVLLTAYPEAQRLLDYEALGLASFYPGALVRVDGRFHRVADPFRRPIDALGSITAPVGTLRDKLLVGLWRQQLRGTLLSEIMERPETTARERLAETGFSERMIERFFRPFFGGTFLEGSLDTSSRMLEFNFKMFSEGPAALPREGMQAIPEQLAAKLPAGSVLLDTPVSEVAASRVVLDGGRELSAEAVVLAVDAAAEHALLEKGSPEGERAWCATTCHYFDAPSDPLEGEPILVLDGDDAGPINNLAVPSSVQPSYAPEGRALISVSTHEESADASLEDVQTQLRAWFGDQVRFWRHIESQKIQRALPDQRAAGHGVKTREVRLDRTLFRCGDHVESASINGAMLSGRRTARAVVEQLLVDRRRRLMAG